eukprot:1251960-Amphidinium_carterae.1
MFAKTQSHLEHNIATNIHERRKGLDSQTLESENLEYGFLTRNSISTWGTRESLLLQFLHVECAYPLVICGGTCVSIGCGGVLFVFAQVKNTFIDVDKQLVDDEFENGFRSFVQCPP